MKTRTIPNVVVTTKNEAYKTDAKRLIGVIQDIIHERIIELEKHGIMLITTPDEVWFCKDEYNKDGSSTLKYIEPKYIRVTDDMITRHSKVDAIYAPDKPIRILREELTEAFKKFERETFISVISDITEENELISECKRLDHLVVNLIQDLNLLPPNAAYPVSNKYQFTISDRNVYKDLDPSTCSFFNYFIGKVEYDLDTNEFVVYNQVSYFNPYMLIYKKDDKKILTESKKPRITDLEVFYRDTDDEYMKDESDDYGYRLPLDGYTECSFEMRSKDHGDIIIRADNPDNLKKQLNDTFKYHTMLSLQHSFITDEGLTLRLVDADAIMKNKVFSSFRSIESFNIDGEYLILNYGNGLKHILPKKKFCRYAYDYLFKPYLHLRILGKIFGKSFKSVELI